MRRGFWIVGYVAGIAACSGAEKVDAPGAPVAQAEVVQQVRPDQPAPTVGVEQPPVDVAQAPVEAAKPVQVDGAQAAPAATTAAPPVESETPTAALGAGSLSPLVESESPTVAPDGILTPLLGTKPPDLLPALKKDAGSGKAGKQPPATGIGALGLSGAGAKFAAAEANFGKHCAKCHGWDGKAQTGMGKKKKIRDWTTKEFQGSGSVADFVKSIANGYTDPADETRSMKGFSAKLSAAEIAELAEAVVAFKSGPPFSKKGGE